MNNSQTQAHGRITQWHDDKGFGFITPSSGSGEVFFHISSYNHRGARPTLGLKVTFTLGLDRQQRYRAHRVRPLNTKHGNNRAARVFNALCISGLFLLLLTALVLLGVLPKLLLWLYCAASLLAFGLYARDKSSARLSRQRTPEAALHWVALLGGWPGALLAQQLLRHKSKKQSFRLVFWLTVLLNVGPLMYGLTPNGQLWLNRAQGFFREFFTSLLNLSL